MPAATELLNPNDYRHIFGLSFCKYEHRPVISIGRGKTGREFSRWDLGRLGVPHAQAAAMLNRAIQQLKIASVDELARQAHAIGTLKGCGVTVYAVLLAILRTSGYDIEQVHEADVTYDSMKKRAIKQEGKHTNGKRR